MEKDENNEEKMIETSDRSQSSFQMVDCKSILDKIRPLDVDGI